MVVLGENSGAVGPMLEFFPPFLMERTPPMGLFFSPHKEMKPNKGEGV